MHRRDSAGEAGSRIGRTTPVIEHMKLHERFGKIVFQGSPAELRANTLIECGSLVVDCEQSKSEQGSL